MGDAWIHLNYALKAGSGDSDMSMLVPESVFAGAENCDYGQAGCTTWLYMYNHFGIQYPNNDGFEEWATQVLPFVQVEKTAEGTFDREYDWDITKDFDGTYSKFIGNSATSHGYEVSVDLTTTDSNAEVTGEITLTVPDKLFPDGEKNAPDAVVTSIEDVFDVGPTTGTVTCPDEFPFTVQAGGDPVVCTYTLAPPEADPGTNTATILIEDNPTPFEATADVSSYTENSVGYTSVNVTDTNGQSWGPVSADTTWTYNKDFACSANPADYTNGSYSYSVTNTASIDETGASDTATVTVDCYAPVVSKTAAGAFDRTYTWTIDKEYDGTYSKFIGDPATDHDYLVTVDKTTTDSNFAVTGTITIENNHPTAAMSLTSVIDSLSSGESATVDCPALSVPAADSVDCTYSAEPANANAGTNTATVAFNGINFPATDGYTFSYTEYGYPTINVTDSIEGALGSASDDATFPYDADFACSANPADYTNGSYSYSVTNTASIDETGPSDTATVTVDCYAPVVSKTAAGAFDRTYTWTIDKEYDGTYSKFIGDPATDHDYLVTVDKTTTDSNFAVTGTITIENNHPTAAMSLTSVIDSLSSGESATVDCPALSVPAADSVDCTYSAEPANANAGTNTATVAFNGINFPATDGYTFSYTEYGYPTINVTDSIEGALGSASDDATFPYDADFACSANPADYTNGSYSYSVTNTASIDETGASDTATVTVDCYAPVVSKTADGTFARDWTWEIDKTGDQTSLELAVGQQFLVNYSVTVTATSADSDYEVTGNIYVENPTGSPGSMAVDVADKIGTTDAVIDCGGGPGDTTLSVASGVTAYCTYFVDFGDTMPSETTNTATVTFNSIDFTATDDFGFSLDEETDECIDLTDSQYGNLGTVCADESPKTITYSMYVGPYPVCATYEFRNIASFVTNDTGATGQDDWIVYIDIPCGGCTLTPGYWKTHSEYGPAPYDDAWSLLDALEGSGEPLVWAPDGNKDGADELFFAPNTGFSWFQVFWMAPKGNVYYQLAHHYQAAVLNVLNEASAPAEVTAAIAHAEELFKEYTPAEIDDLKGNKGLRKDFLATMSTLAQYNEGYIGPGHCDEDQTSAAH